MAPQLRPRRGEIERQLPAPVPPDDPRSGPSKALIPLGIETQFPTPRNRELLLA